MTKIVAELGLSHDGSLGYAFGMVEAVAAAGAQAVKFQNHTLDECNNFRPGTSFPQDLTRQDYWIRTSFTRGEWHRLIAHTHECGLEFGVSVFSEPAVAMLEGAVDFWKIGSAQTSNLKLIEKVRGTAPVVISTGMSNLSEIDAAYRTLEGTDVTILQCTTKYPTAPEDLGLNVMADIGQTYWCKVGLSDHSGQIWPSIVAASLGADMVEVHCTWDKRQWGPDVSSSITVDDLGRLVEGVRFVERMTRVDKNAVNMTEMREVFR